MINSYKQPDGSYIFKAKWPSLKKAFLYKLRICHICTLKFSVMYTVRFRIGILGMGTYPKVLIKLDRTLKSKALSRPIVNETLPRPLQGR